MKKEYIENIERLEIMEEKFGIILEGLNAEISFYEDDDTMSDVYIYGEIHAANGSTIEEDIVIVLTAYDKNGKVIGTGKEYIEKENFFAIHSLDGQISNIISKPAKIRIYPTKQ